MLHGLVPPHSYHEIAEKAATRRADASSRNRLDAVIGRA